MCEREVMKADLPGHLAGRREQADEQLAEVVGADAVEIMLPLAARLDQAGDAEQGEVVAHRGLALAEPGAKIGDVQFAVLGEIEEDSEPRLVAQELEDLGA